MQIILETQQRSTRCCAMEFGRRSETTHTATKTRAPGRQTNRRSRSGNHPRPRPGLHAPAPKSDCPAVPDNPIPPRSGWGGVCHFAQPRPDVTRKKEKLETRRKLRMPQRSLQGVGYWKGTSESSHPHFPWQRWPRLFGAPTIVGMPLGIPTRSDAPYSPVRFALGGVPPRKTKLCLPPSSLVFSFAYVMFSVFVFSFVYVGYVTPSFVLLVVTCLSCLHPISTIYLSLLSMPPSWRSFVPSCSVPFLMPVRSLRVLYVFSCLIFDIPLCLGFFSARALHALRSVHCVLDVLGRLQRKYTSGEAACLRLSVAPF